MPDKIDVAQIIKMWFETHDLNGILAACVGEPENKESLVVTNEDLIIW